MIGFRHRLVISFVFASNALPALAEPLSTEAKDKILGLMLESTSTITMALTEKGDPGKGLRDALARCRDAENVAKRYDPNPYWDGFIAECKAEAEIRLKDKKSACADYALAIQSFRAIPAGDRMAKDGAKKLTRVQRSSADARCG
jgi:hypothetical protein